MTSESQDMPVVLSVNCYIDDRTNLPADAADHLMWPL